MNNTLYVPRRLVQSGELRNVLSDDRNNINNIHRQNVGQRQRSHTTDSSRYNSTRPTIRSLRVANTPHFYDSTEESYSDVSGSYVNITTKQKITQSKRLPNWIWCLVTSVLGVNDSFKWLATILYILTIVSALAFTFLGVLFVVYDISSLNSKTTLHIGAISLLLGFGWLALGIYSFKLAGRLFGDKDFAASVRGHSRTLFKISSAVFLIISGFLFTGLNLYSAFVDTYAASHCHVIGLHHLVCNSMFISRVIFTTFSVIWNLMVGCMLLSVCRTHTIGIRRFVRDLELDGNRYENFWRQKLLHSKQGEYNKETNSILCNSDWFNPVEVDSNDEIPGSINTDVNDRQPVNNACTQPVNISRQQQQPGNQSDDVVLMRDSNSPQETNRQGDDGNNENDDNSDNDSIDDEPNIMTDDEILLCYWKISSRMRFTSRCLQRWLASWLAFVGVWCADYVIYWLSHSPDVLGILQFVAPMFLVLVLCSAYAEANGEGQVMIRCICPTKDRYGLLNFLRQQPLQMQVFSLSISYNAILTVILAFSVAFSSRLILDEVVKN
ncbi:hypothetical protein ACF0H5_022363 [Mactra antiquata]